MSETTHLCPPGVSGVMPCCLRTPFEVPRSDRLTLDPERVTCSDLRVLIGDADLHQTGT